jgi:hypothetical protein
LNERGKKGRSEDAERLIEKGITITLFSAALRKEQRKRPNFLHMHLSVEEEGIILIQGIIHRGFRHFRHCTLVHCTPMLKLWPYSLTIPA